MSSHAVWIGSVSLDAVLLSLFLHWSRIQCNNCFTLSHLSCIAHVETNFTVKVNFSQVKPPLGGTDRHFWSRQQTPANTATLRDLLVVPRHHLSSYGRRAFSVAGPAIWNCLPGTDSLRDLPISRDSLSIHWRCYYFQLTRLHSALELSERCALQICLLTYCSSVDMGQCISWFTLQLSLVLAACTA